MEKQLQHFFTSFELKFNNGWKTDSKTYRLLLFTKYVCEIRKMYDLLKLIKLKELLPMN